MRNVETNVLNSLLKMRSLLFSVVGKKFHEGEIFSLLISMRENSRSWISIRKFFLCQQRKTFVAEAGQIYANIKFYYLLAGFYTNKGITELSIGAPTVSVKN